MKTNECQAVVDTLLSSERQAEERMADGSYRVRCMTCGKSVSNPLPVAVIVRVWVECPECIERRLTDPNETAVTAGLER